MLLQHFFKTQRDAQLKILPSINMYKKQTIKMEIC